MKTKKLKKILGKALANGFSRGTPAPWIRGTPYETEFLKHLQAPKAIEDELLAYLKTQPEFEVFNNKMFNMGGGSWTIISFRNLMQWLFFTAETAGIDEALSRLVRYSKIAHTPSHAVLAISGIKIEKPYEIAPGIHLIPFDSIPDSDVKRALDPPILKAENLARIGAIDFVPSLRHMNVPLVALVKADKLSPKSADSEKIKNHIPNNSILSEACEYLTLISDCAPVPVARWNIIDDWVPCSGFVGEAWTTLSNDILNNSVCTLKDENIEEIKLGYPKFAALEQKVKDKLRIPIQRLNQCRRRRNIADKAIDLGISFESLFMNDRGSSEQISLTFRLRAAWFLGNNQKNRADLINKFKKIYDCRSMAVHNGKLHGTLKLYKGQDPVTTHDFLLEADSLCKRSITKIIDQGSFPDWDIIILG